MTEQRFIVSFGEREIAEGVVSARTRVAADNVVYAQVVVSNGALLNANPDYKAEAQLFSVTDSGRELVLTGLVDAVMLGEEETKIVLQAAPIGYGRRRGRPFQR